MRLKRKTGGASRVYSQTIETHPDPGFYWIASPRLFAHGFTTTYSLQWIYRALSLVNKVLRLLYAHCRKAAPVEYCFKLHFETIYEI